MYTCPFKQIEVLAITLKKTNETLKDLSYSPKNEEVLRSIISNLQVAVENIHHNINPLKQILHEEE